MRAIRKEAALAKKLGNNGKNGNNGKTGKAGKNGENTSRMKAKEIRTMLEKLKRQNGGVNFNPPLRYFVSDGFTEKDVRARFGELLENRRTKPVYSVPVRVRRAAAEGLKLNKAGFKGGEILGKERALQLTGKDGSEGKVSAKTLYVMRAWFARHGPDAKNRVLLTPTTCAGCKRGNRKTLAKDQSGEARWLGCCGAGTMPISGSRARVCVLLFGQHIQVAKRHQKKTILCNKVIK